MKYLELEKLASRGILTIHRYNVGKFNRTKYVYSNEPDICDQKLIKVEKVPYTRYYYSARSNDMPSHKSYKITAGDYKNLLKAGAKEE